MPDLQYVLVIVTSKIHLVVFASQVDHCSKNEPCQKPAVFQLFEYVSPHVKPSRFARRTLLRRFWMSQLELEYHDLMSLFELLGCGLAGSRWHWKQMWIFVAPTLNPKLLNPK